LELLHNRGGGYPRENFFGMTPKNMRGIRI
jgi:hypothetical protein